jgi:two-component system, chemotaxis family, protein-glutamate methylesterase/glutaminase
MATPAKLRVLIVDDTALYRKIMRDAAASLSADLEVIAAVGTGELAVQRVAQGGVDLVLLDVVMPGLDGLATLKILHRDQPTLPVVLVSGVTGRDATNTVSALSAGALDFIPKPAAASLQEGMQKISSELQRITDLLALRRLVGTPTAKSVERPVAVAGAARPARLATPPPISLCVVAVSTGGPKALQDVIPRLPVSLGVPVLLVQHMPVLFTRTLAEQLDKVSQVRVREATAGEVLAPGVVYIAPGGQHLKVKRREDGRYATVLDAESPPVNACRPAADVLFRSVAELAPRGVLAVVLTGMGDDGAAGVAALKVAAPTYCLVQDAATSVVYGMPAAVAQRGLADEVLPLSQIAARIAACCPTRALAA